MGKDLDVAAVAAALNRAWESCMITTTEMRKSQIMASNDGENEW